MYYYRYIPLLLFLFLVFTSATKTIFSLEKRQSDLFDDSFQQLELDEEEEDTPLNSPDFTDSNYLNASDESPTSMNQDIYDTTKLFKHPPTLIDINDYIRIKLYCEVDSTLCQRVENALISAALRIHKVIQLKTKIVFQASYYSFCMNKCANQTYGWGSPSSQYTLNSLNAADSNFIYPQALAKQLAQFTDSSKWVDYDAAVEINHDIYMINQQDSTSPPISNGSTIPSIGGFWFNNQTNSKSNTASPIAEYQVDMEYVILHQMIHGLGMVSSWAPYFSDVHSPFQKLLNGLIQPDKLKMITPSPFWYIQHNTGPTFVTGFQPSLIFDKFLHLFFSASNQTVPLMDYGFDMQNFCVPQDHAFIVYFIKAFLNNATQSTRAKSMYVAMSEENALSFRFNHSIVNLNSSFLTNNWLNQTYTSIQLSTGLYYSNTSSSMYYRPGICTSHVADKYMNTPDFLMTEEYAKGVTLDALIEKGYATAPNITYNVTETILVNVTTSINNTQITSTIQKEQITEHVYRSAIGPGILRILETIGYSSVLTNTNYTTSVIKSNKIPTDCNDNNNNNNYPLDDDMAMNNKNPLRFTRMKSHSNTRYHYNYFCILFLIFICII